MTATPESALFYGYRQSIRSRRPATEPCACGGLIVADSRGDADVAAAIRAHQSTDQHAAWRLATFGEPAR